MESLRERSPRFKRPNDEDRDGGDDDVISLELFQSVEIKHSSAVSSSPVTLDVVAYVGGSCWTLDWTPSGSHVACEGRGEKHHAHALRDVGKCKGKAAVQIWDVCDTGVRMAVGMVHDGGCAHDLKWSPFRGRDRTRIEASDEESLGTLACARGDGRVETWNVPRPSTRSGETVFVESKAMFVGVVPGDYGAPWRLDWNDVVPGRLCAGCTSGRVVVWDVPDHESDASPTYPKFVIAAAAHAGPCRAVRWPRCEIPEDENACANILACGSDYAAKPHLFDLRAPFAPIGDVCERGAKWTLDMAWLPRGGVVLGMEHSDRSSAKSIRGETKQTAANVRSRALVVQFDLIATEGEDSNPTSMHPVPGRGTVWSVDARAGFDPACAASMFACATSNGVVCVKPMRYVSKRLRDVKAFNFDVFAGLLAHDVESKRACESNPVEPPECFEFITSNEQVPADAELYPPLEAAKPGTRDAPTTAQYCARWSKDRDGGWWLASAGEAGFLRLQKFDSNWIETKLGTLERAHRSSGEKSGAKRAKKT